MRSELQEPASPCVEVCRIDPVTGLCLGCRRTLDEIARWRDFSAAEKKAVLERLASRHNEPDQDSKPDDQHGLK